MRRVGKHMNGGIRYHHPTRAIRVSHPHRHGESTNPLETSARRDQDAQDTLLIFIPIKIIGFQWFSAIK